MPIECVNCGALNPEEKRFCGDCGTPIGSDMSQQINSILDQRLKDQKLIEIETSEAIVSRISNWAKLFGYFIGIPVAIVVLLLGFFGIRTYGDIASKLKIAIQEADSLNKKIAGIKTETTELEKIVEKIDIVRPKLDSTEKQIHIFEEKNRALTTKYQSVESQIASLENKLASVDSKAEGAKTLAIELQQKVEQLEGMGAFQSYLERLGFEVPKGQVIVDIHSDSTRPSFYSPTENRILIWRSVVNDHDFIFRLYAHHVLTTYRPIATESKDYQFVESGLADYFPCSFKNDALMAEVSAAAFKENPSNYNYPNSRNLVNERKFNELKIRMDAEDGGEVWGGAFWEIRKILGQNVSDRLLCLTWTKLDSSDFIGTFSENLVERLLNTARSLVQSDQLALIEAVFDERQFRKLYSRSR